MLQSKRSTTVSECLLLAAEHRLQASEDVHAGMATGGNMGQTVGCNRQEMDYKNKGKRTHKKGQVSLLMLVSWWTTQPSQHKIATAGMVVRKMSPKVYVNAKTTKRKGVTAVFTPYDT